MKSYKPIQDAFKRLNTDIKSWHKHSGFPFSAETVAKIINRDLPVDASTLAYLAACLDMKNAEIGNLLAAYGKEYPAKAGECAIMIKLIAPSDLGRTEDDMIKKLRAVSDKQRKSIMQMVETL